MSESSFVGDNHSYASDSNEITTSNLVRTHHTNFNITTNTTEWRNLLNTTLFQVKIVKVAMMLRMTIMMLQDYPEWMLMSGFGCCVMFLVCGLPGNIITILALARCKKVSILDTR